MKQEDENSKRYPSDGTALNLAEGLVALLDDTQEYCTPGHRRGHGYHLLAAGLSEAIGTDRQSASTREPGGGASPELH